MDITFRLPGPWGPGKGSNLQPNEVDNNFWELAEAILYLQNNPPLPTSIQSISVSGTQMTITLTDGTVLGPYTLPVLTFRWRGEWQPATPYAELDVFTVTNTGIFMVQVAHTSDIFFDPNYTVGGLAAYLQLFGSTDASLAGLSDVDLDDLQPNDFLSWNGGAWVNAQLGSMAFEAADNVNITGGSITGMPTPVNPSDVATKAYIDALPGGATAPDLTMMSNISGATAPAIPNTFTDFLDAVLGVPPRGTLLYRGGPGWIALAPGTSGQFLQTLGSGFDPTWAAGSAGITSLTAGVGIDTQPDTIVATGIIALAPLADKRLLANVSGASAPPTETTLSALLDSILTNARGTLLTRMAAGWVGLSPGTNGYYLRTNGAGADVTWDAPAGAGTVTSVASGAGLTGGPITGTGTLALASVANNNLLANISGVSAAPAATTVSQLLDSAIGTTQGSVIYRSGTTWVALGPGTSGQILTTAGASANPSWQNAPITGGAINSPRVLANISGSTATPTATTMTNLLDATIGSVRGMIMFRAASGWTSLAAGTSGFVLTTRGTGADPQWTAPGTGGAIYNPGEVLGNPTGSAAAPAATDAARMLRASVGDGTAGQVLTSSGAGVNPAWAAGATLPSGSTHDQLVYVSGAWSAQRPKYVVACYVPSTQTASQNLLFHRFSKGVTIPANAGAYLGHTSEAAASAAATGSTVITFAKAASATPTSFTDVGQITFAAGAAVGTWTTAAGGAVFFAQGDILRLRAPATADATLADVHVTLVGFET